ncbi:MAG: right handed beta helix region family protein, partial [Nocardioidaceae bacterium]|nr:right handed beta helix region family protein [Nocardioidaceae bacterium]
MFFWTRRTGVHARLTLVGMIAGFALAVTALQGLPSPANAAVQTFTVNPTTTVGPTGLKIKHKNLNQNTKQYFLIRTYLEYFEKVGGGKLILSKGTYRVPNTLYVGSNVTIHLNSGAILAKWNKTKGMKVAASMFQTIRQSKSKKKGYYGGYNGEKNITFEGDPGSFFDLNNFKTGLGIVAGHTQNLTVKGIGFREMNYGHYIDISATKHKIITGNAFGRTKAG